MNMKDDLKAFVDNEVSEEERTRILKEAENNPALQAELIELRQISRVIKEEAWQPQPVGLEKTLRALESAKAKRPWWQGPSFNWAVGGACTVMLIAILMPVLQRNQDSMAETAASVPKMESYAASSPASSGQIQDQDKSMMETPASPPDTGAGVTAKSRTPAADLPPAREDSAPSVAPQASMRNEAFSPKVDTGWSGVAGAPPKIDYGQMNTYADGFATNLDLEVDDVAEAQTRAKDIAKKFDGRAESNLSNDSSTLTLKVPRARYGQAVDDLKRLGKIQNVKPVDPPDLVAQVPPVQAGSSRGIDSRDLNGAEYKRSPKEEPSKDATINLSLKEHRFAITTGEAPRDAATQKRYIDVAGFFTALFRWSPVWMPIILLAWWIARRRAGG